MYFYRCIVACVYECFGGVCVCVCVFCAFVGVFWPVCRRAACVRRRIDWYGVFVVVFQVFQVLVIAAVFCRTCQFLSYSLGVRCLFGCFVISIRISPRKVGFF